MLFFLIQCYIEDGTWGVCHAFVVQRLMFVMHDMTQSEKERMEEERVDALLVCFGYKECLL